jgi:hypothetical protein
MNLGYGEFDYPDQSARRAALHNLFLEAVRVHAPEVLKELHDGPYAAYCELRFKHNLAHERIIRSPNAQNVKEFHQKLNACLSKWHLDACWCLLAVYDTLNTWACFYPEGPSNLFFQLVSFGTGFFAPPALPAASLIDRRREYLVSDGLPKYPTPPEYKPEMMYRWDYLKHVEAYCDEVEKAYEAAGWHRCLLDEKRQLEKHLEWAVRYQVKRKTLDDIVAAEDSEGRDAIAADCRVNDVSTISRAVKDVLSLIGLKRRPRIRKKDDSRKKVRSEIRRALAR